jgi:hypothetical protein
MPTGLDQLTGLLRSSLRQAEGRDSQPTACILDSQSIKTSANVPLTQQGIDPAKKRSASRLGCRMSFVKWAVGCTAVPQ